MTNEANLPSGIPDPDRTNRTGTDEHNRKSRVKQVQKANTAYKSKKNKTWHLLKQVLLLTGNLNRYLFLAVTSAIIISIITVVQCDFIARLTDSMLAADIQRLKRVAFATIVLEIAAIILITIQKASIGYFGHSSLARINSQAAYKISHAQASYMTHEHSGQILSRLTSDLGLVQTLLQNNLLRFMSGSLTAFLAVCYMFYKNWLLAIVAVFGTPVIFIVVGKLNRPVANLSREAQEALGEIYIVMEESIAGASVLKVFGLAKNLSARFCSYNRLWLNKAERRNTFSALLASLGFVMSFTPFLLVFGVGGLLMLKGQVSFGVLFAFINLLNFVASPMQELPRVMGDIASNSAALERILEIMEMPSEREDGESLEFIDHAPVVEFRNVTFSYPESETPAVDNVSFTVKQGEKIAFAGSSGSGKSTIFRLLLGEYEPEQGSIMVGGHDIKKWSLKSLRSHFSKVSQDTYLFPYSVMENLTIGMVDTPVKEVMFATEIACAESFVRELPDGYETPLGEMAGRLSGGERQRLSLARAVLRKPQVLLLDEATSAMDYNIEHQVLGGLLEALQNVTMLAIAHRLSTIVNSDRIYVLEDGAIVESGNHASLMKTQSRYASLYAKQADSQTAGIAQGQTCNLSPYQSGEVQDV